MMHNFIFRWPILTCYCLWPCEVLFFVSTYNKRGEDRFRWRVWLESTFFTVLVENKWFAVCEDYRGICLSVANETKFFQTEDISKKKMISTGTSQNEGCTPFFLLRCSCLTDSLVFLEVFSSIFLVSFFEVRGMSLFWMCVALPIYPEF